MKSDLSCRLKAYIQPFERELAYRELEALTDVTLPRNRYGTGGAGLTLISEAHPDILVRELAFWESVSNGERMFTRQVLRESTVNDAAKTHTPQLFLSGLTDRQEVSLPKRRCLRYGPHGVHEYRGKFFPQLVRALINIGRVPVGGIVADPFSGSGTTSIETILADRAAIGLDMNPLSAFMSKAKCDILAVSPKALEKEYNKVKRTLAVSFTNEAQSWISKLCVEDQDYLSHWFHSAVLKDLDRIAVCIRRVSNASVRNFMFLCLSNVLRRVSWQKNDDLRVRRESKKAGNIDPLKEFLDELDRSTKLMLAFLRQEYSLPIGTADIEQGDSRQLAKYWHRWRGKVNAVITSPPYATALPYLDTDRLSLCFLGLLTRPEYRNHDYQMIGNREISEKARKELWQAFCSYTRTLPASISKLVIEIDKLNRNSEVGFRRRNLPALLYKYFSDMSLVFGGMIELLKKGASAFIVVGNNHTFAGGRRIEIKTIQLLTELAEEQGFETVDQLSMEMLTSRDIFRKNAIESESILHFRKPYQ
jgi:site-specific DNA-methyltransferase (cytosine-N4-specific)